MQTQTVYCIYNPPPNINVEILATESDAHLVIKFVKAVKLDCKLAMLVFAHDTRLTRNCQEVLINVT